MTTEHYYYDLESYPNFFSLRATRDSDGGKYCYEISEWVNQGAELFEFLNAVKASGGVMVGFNNLSYDYTLVHLIYIMMGQLTHVDLYTQSQAIIRDQKFDRFAHCIPEWEILIPQIDLLRIHHMDNKAKMTSLKELEFNMRMDDIQDLPYDPNYPVTYEQSRHLLTYNDYDVDATREFGHHSAPLIEFRESLTKQYGKSFMNHNDTRIGADIVKMELEKRGIKCNKWTQTHRDRIALNDIIFPYVKFEHPEFNRVLEYFRGTVMDPDAIKGFFKQMDEEGHKFTSAVINGFSFDFGAGGIHGSIRKEVVVPREGEVLIDSDVASYYPNLGIKNRLYPEHLGTGWCDVMDFMYHERLRVGKKTDQGNAYKLGLNGSYGKSNDIHSPFYDPQYTMSITINGQLLLCMLAEQLMKIDGVRMIQINTDGLTYTCPADKQEFAMRISEWWEQVTQLELEHVEYSKMCVRDVNNYLAVTTDGKIKRIGAYAYVRAAENSATREVPWHKNHSALVIKKAAEAALVHGTNIEQFIRNHHDIHDFMLRAKVPRSCQLIGVQSDGSERKLDRITRYFVAKEGVSLVKVMPPTAKQIENWGTVPHWRHVDTGAHKCAKKAPSGKWKRCPPPTDVPPDRRIGIDAKWVVMDCNWLSDEPIEPHINIDYYVEEARKLVDELMIGGG